MKWDLVAYDEAYEKININMRCIEIIKIIKIRKGDKWLTLTWDVLKWIALTNNGKVFTD